MPAALARRGITGARHDLPAGMEVNCARDLALIFGDEIRAHVQKLAAVSRQPTEVGSGQLSVGSAANCKLQTANSAEAEA